MDYFSKLDPPLVVTQNREQNYERSLRHIQSSLNIRAEQFRVALNKRKAEENFTQFYKIQETSRKKYHKVCSSRVCLCRVITKEQ
jgi:hypothetical protein